MTVEAALGAEFNEYLGHVKPRQGHVPLGIHHQNLRTLIFSYSGRRLNVCSLRSMVLPAAADLLTAWDIAERIRCYEAVEIVRLAGV